MLRTRAITALIALIVFSSVLFLSSNGVWLFFSTAVAAVGAWEWARMLGFSPSMRLLYPLVTALYCGFIGTMAVFPGYAPHPALTFHYVLASLFWILLAPLWLKWQWKISAHPLLAALLGWLVVIPAGLALTELRALGEWRLLAVMAVVWIADSAAYFAGRAFGKHKLAPTVSPGKTWEGAFGATVAVVAYGLALIAPEDSSIFAVVAGLVVLTGVSIVGDLFESLVKRQAGYKDSSQLLPGHGGILDRIDSLTSTLPLISLVVHMRFYQLT